MPDREIRNPVFSSADNSLIDVEYNHPDLGWIPFTAGAADVEPLGVEIFDLALAMSPAPYVPVPPPPYSIAKTTPWRRMTDEEGAAVMAVMDTASPRLRGLYDAALYLSTGDELWGIMRDLLASAVGGYERADELLAPET